MIKSAVGRRVPGGALDKSVRVDSRTTASMANRISASLASHTAPGRRNHNAIPAATPTLVIASLAPRKITESVDRAPMFQTLEAAWKAKVPGFQIVKMKIRTRIQGVTTVHAVRAARRQTAGSLVGSAEGDEPILDCAFARRFDHRSRAPSMYT